MTLKVLVVILIINCLIGLMRTEEDICTLIFDDCHTCVTTEGCGWCDSGFCLSRADNLFTCKNELSLDEGSCPAMQTRNKRQNPFCSQSQSCSECNLITSCGWCIYYPNSNQVFESCQPLLNPDSTVCPMNQYGNFNSSFVTVCPGSNSSTGPIHAFTKNPANPPIINIAKRNELRIPDPKVAVNLTAQQICIFMVRGLQIRLAEIGSSIQIGGDNCLVQTWQPVNPANNSLIPSEAKAEFLLRWVGLNPDDVALIENTTIFTIEHYNPYILPIVIAKFSSGGGSNPLSPGQVAGITIGAVFGFLLLLLLLFLLLLLLLRRRPQKGPFRSPAASFRP